MYSDVKTLHISLVAISFGLFLLRGFWMIRQPDILQTAWVKRSPHVIDTLLLGSGIGLIIMTGITPLNSLWLGAKLGLLITYIILGAFALHYGATRPIRYGCFGLAVLTFITMVYLARVKPL